MNADSLFMSVRGSLPDRRISGRRGKSASDAHENGEAAGQAGPDHGRVQLPARRHPADDRERGADKVIGSTDYFLHRYL